MARQGWKENRREADNYDGNRLKKLEYLERGNEIRRREIKEERKKTIWEREKGKKDEVGRREG